MKKFLLQSSLTLLTALTLNANEVYNVDKLILEALQNSPDLKVGAYNYDASQKRIDVNTAQYLPNLNLHLELGELGMSDVPTNPDKMINDSYLLGNLSLQQIIYDFGKTGSNVKSSEYESETFSMDKEQQISDKIKDVKVAYYAVLQAIAIIKVNEENVKLNEIQLYRSQKYFTAGIRTKIDVSDAKVGLIQATLNLRESEYDLKLAYTKLDKVVGFMELEKSYNVQAKDLNLTNLYSTLNSYDLKLKESIEYAYKHRYKLKSLNATIKSSKVKEEKANAEYYPAIYFNADYTRQEQDSFINTPSDQWKAAVNLDWNLYQGGATSSATEEKIIQTQISNSEYLNTKLSIKNEVTQTFINLYKVKDTVELSQSLLAVSKEKFDQAAKRYEHGLSDYIELQQSRQGYIDAMANLVINYYDYYTAVALLDNAIGK